MPEKPDFVTLAQQIANYFSTDLTKRPARDPYVVLKEVWNARGAADIAKLKDVLVDDGPQPSLSTSLMFSLRVLDCQLPENSTSTK